MGKSPDKPVALPAPLAVLAKPLPRSYFNYMGQRLIDFIDLIWGLGAFTLITVGVMLTKRSSAIHVLHPLIRAQIRRAGSRLLPIIVFMAFALGFVVVGQMVAFLTKMGAQNLAGTVMVIVVVRELGPLVTALLVLTRVGTATVIELGTLRANGEIEALEALGIDPVHYLVVPRVLGLAISIFSLTVYFILIALFSGYLFIFLQDIPLLPGEYINQIAQALRWEDFVILAFKTFIFGAIIALVICYEGLANPLLQEEIAGATTKAMVLSLELCVAVDALFIGYLLFL